MESSQGWEVDASFSPLCGIKKLKFREIKKLPLNKDKESDCNAGDPSLSPGESQELAPEDMEASWRSRLSGRPGPGTAALESGLPHLATTPALTRQDRLQAHGLLYYLRDITERSAWGCF